MKFRKTRYESDGVPLFSSKWRCHICGSKILTDKNRGYSCYINYCIKCDKEFIKVVGIKKIKNERRK